MAHKQSVGLPVAILFLSSLGTALAPAQARTNPDEAGPTVGATSRLAGDWRSTTSVVVAGSQAPVTQTAADLGASQPDAGLQRMLLLLAPSAAQQQALSAELANLQNPASPQYHQWLTPSAFAAS